MSESTATLLTLAEYLALAEAADLSKNDVTCRRVVASNKQRAMCIETRSRRQGSPAC